jgi:hypothetical protein
MVKSILAACVVALGVGACGGSSSSSSSAPPGTLVESAPPTTTASATARPVSTSKPKPSPAAHPRLLAAALGPAAGGFVPVATWQGHPAAWLARSSSGVTLLSVDQRLLELRLHSGTADAGAVGWRYGPSVAGLERARLVAAFNGGFRLSVGAGGFMSYGRAAVPLRDGLGSVVTYTDGTTDVGAWHQEVPAPDRTVASVRQNLPLLVDHGHAAPTLDCLSCWGATLGGVLDPARSALGITGDGRLVWAGGEHLTVAQLASALVASGAIRAVELDINPEWVAGYLYGHRGGHGPTAPVPVVPGQNGIPGAFLAPWSRDFFTVVAR